MNVIAEIVSKGPRYCREMARKAPSAEETFRSFKKLNNKLINHALGVEGTPEIRYEEDIPYIFCSYVWLQPCCSDCTQIQDMFNESQVAGILFCKYAFFGTQDARESLQTCSVVQLFPEITEIHVDTRPILTLDIDQIMLLTASAQHYWKKMVHLPHTIQLLFLLCCRMGQFMLFNNIAGPSSSEHVEVIPESDNVLRVRKKTVRTFLCATLVMFRSLTLQQTSVCVKLGSLADEERNIFLRVQCYNESKQADMAICDAIHNNIMRIKSLRSAHGGGEGTATMQGSDLYKYISSRMPEDAIGMPPRKITDEMQTLLRNVCVFQEAAGNFFDQGVCLEECAMVLQTALRFFYISPAVETFKKLSLLADVNPGQRLTYAFDFVHFDTGQISQVVFLHNPLYRQSKPPQTVAEWDHDDVCGPIAAFMSFDPTVQIWLEDSEDPLGILEHRRQITRPADHDKADEEKAKEIAQHGRYAFVLNKKGIFLVDRDTSQVYTSRRSSTDRYHHVLYLLCLFVSFTGKTQDVCKVAINSFKLCGVVGANT
tara:strand:- start:8859 stop:10481 length:1623 start_codon:yes stop_codon:yes gene_type:complete